MCAACVAQGVVYVGGALAGLQVMAARSRAKRGDGGDDRRPAEAADAAESTDPSLRQ